MNYFLTYAVYVVILSLLMGISTWKLFKKMGYNPVFAFVPFYNYFIILKETKHPKWWALLSYLPIVGPIMMSVFHIYLMKKFGKSLTQQQLLTVFLPFIYMAVVNYSKDTELEDESMNDMFLTEEEKNAKKKDSFIGSITFAVVFATIIHVFVTQPFGIPTGSMERTLLVGDFLFVNKWSYGYRLPMRPVAIPFLQGTIFDTGQPGNPKDDPKSYVDAVKLPYERIFQLNKPQKNDIVVFNYPQDSVHTATDRKDPYVKRCVAVAGDTFEMRGGRLFVNGKPETVLGDQEVQHRYIVTTGSQLDIPSLYNIYGFLPVQEQQTDKGFIYGFQGLTDKVAADIKALPQVIDIKEDIQEKGLAAVFYRDEAKKKIDTTQSIFPINKPWNQDWYGPLKIPKKGDVVAINKETLPEYRWIISEYEHNNLEEKGNQIFINGQPATTYTIKQDYYMMIGDNRDASLDARFFGFVPEENIVGKPMFTWMSLQGAFKDNSSSYQAPFKIRWDRMFKATNTGESNKASYWWIAAMILILFFGWEYFVKLFRKKNTGED
ncbi:MULTISPECIES: signal peptidase I [Chryseobacterium]|uniref:Signal peptidase I n=1 Tax=Chryseobacterium camelliae TaxID=1265445 RepID=A0ABU0TJB4_9FLAO|nr:MULTISPECIES: signal peptidase I [Chryseobacterium]MDT3409006.1 signal peptidase I [Pseudacidovorax intermedius]MDQ1097136.1 signal peptidase I [Chryseobacterium camelliae]MDQ1101073.1 signal peptidase I [Chryseobacterium sp. SORGH_AS_1048]MDR6084516.1 signal peptidase I [Chryseobacterium sp. SORGH_AS_0909]MDR6132786.1 signal peptidase I [Chryseobacterium sp. SORGH_AS_1175]